MDKIIIKKARVHNLKEINVTIPRNAMTVITGPSGSGKSSLAFDTLYAEGQRRYIESLSSYARQFLGQMEPPDVESITGLSPAIAIDQKSTIKNPRSTVGTVTEVYDYMRVLWARVGDPHCPESGELLEAQSPQMIVKDLLKLKEGSKVVLYSPVIRRKKGEHKEEMAKYMAHGFAKIRVDGEDLPIDDNLGLNKNKAHDIEILVDRVIIRKDVEARLTDSVELALQLSKGYLIAKIDNKKEQFYSESLFSHKTGKSYQELEPRIFSFNSPLGACPTCNGIGETKIFDKNIYIVDQNLSLLQGAITPLSKSNFLYQMVLCVAEAEKVDLKKPLNKLPKKFLDVLYEGSTKAYTYKFSSENSKYQFKKRFAGIEPWLLKKYEETSNEKTRLDLEQYMRIERCPSCDGNRLAPYPLAVSVGRKSIVDASSLSIEESVDFFKKIKLTGQKKIIAEKLLKEIIGRLKFLNDVGLGYLTLNRTATSLSGGESQRIRLATQIGSALSGVLYVLDEPSIGLHQRDNQKLIKTLINLRDLGNTVIIVEHDEETMRAADHLIDMGPGAGHKGGTIVAKGTPAQVGKNSSSITGRYLSGKESIEVPQKRREIKDFLKLRGATENNLSKVDIEIPLGGLSFITGVSGSGKSTLLHKVLVPAVKFKLKRTKVQYKNYQSLTGVEQIQSIIELDQSPIGRTPKSNPATYTGLFDQIRTLFSQTNEAKVRGYRPGRFSFNVKGGRCENCQGNGTVKIEMSFLPDVYINCEECDGKRYNEETLVILYRGKNISDVLKMSIEEAEDFFINHKKIARALNVLNSIGLGYMKLGQPAPTLSGGEAQRLKLSRELSKMPRGHCLYILDEPTTGLHFEDIKVLLKALNKLVEGGHSVIVIEHNLDAIKTGDYVIDLGPEGGKAGGKIVAKGTPEQVAKTKKSLTGEYLNPLL